MGGLLLLFRSAGGLLFISFYAPLVTGLHGPLSVGPCTLLLLLTGPQDLLLSLGTILGACGLNWLSFSTVQWGTARADMLYLDWSDCAHWHLVGRIQDAQSNHLGHYCCCHPVRTAGKSSEAGAMDSLHSDVPPPASQLAGSTLDRKRSEKRSKMVVNGQAIIGRPSNHTSSLPAPPVACAVCCLIS